MEHDSRGILDPWLLRKRVALTRYPVEAPLAGLVDRFWAVRWDLPDGIEHRQNVLTHPGANVTVGHADARDDPGPIQARLQGVTRAVSTRVLAGRGWAVAAMTSPGGLGAFITGPASRLRDRSVVLGCALDLDDAALITEIVAAGDEETRIGVLARALEGVLERADPRRVRRARQVADVAGLLESDRSLQQLSDVVATTGMGVRTLQRLFSQEAGVSPAWVLRRYRLLDAAEAVRQGQGVSWADLATELGYADQPHLVRDFRATLGTTPAAYAASQQSG